MSKSRPPFDAESLQALPTQLPSDVRLSPRERELLGCARQQHQAGRAPGSVRQRLLARALDDARNGAGSAAAEPGLHAGAVAAAPLIVVPVWSWRASLWLASAAAIAVVLLLQVRELIRRSGEERARFAAAEQRSRAGAASKRWLDSPLFQAPAPALPAGALPPDGADEFPEPPFSARSAAWQLRRWDDLSVAPTQPVTGDFVQGALCVRLGAGERVLGGWPWAPDGGVVPRGVPLEPGQRYRLSFRAWAHDPLPAQLLVAVGHARLPFSAAGGARVPLTTEPQTFVVEVGAERGDPSVGVAFLATGADEAAPTQLCLRDFRLVQER